MSEKLTPPNGLKGALLRFRTMAVVMGITSLGLWFIDLPTKFWDKNLHQHLAIIGIVHGMLYPIYVIAAFFYCLKSGKSFVSTVVFILAGTLPILSFVAERKAIKDFQVKYKS
jgi:integral membrane protein